MSHLLHQFTKNLSIRESGVKEKKKLSFSILHGKHMAYGSDPYGNFCGKYFKELERANVKTIRYKNNGVTYLISICRYSRNISIFRQQYFKLHIFEHCLFVL